MFSSVLSIALLSLVLPLFTSAERHGPSRRHSELASRKRGDLQHYQRDANARFTFFAVGLGSCGKTNVPSDYIVALNSCQYDGGSHCFQMITITAMGKTTSAQIMDQCPGCPCGGLDMSVGLFTFFGSESLGVITGSWDYQDGSGGGGSAPPPAPSSSKKPKPSSTWTPPPSSTWTPPPSTSSSWTSTSESSSSTWSSSPSSSSSTTFNSTSSSTSYSSTSTNSSPSVTPTPTVVPLGGTTAAPQNLQGLYAVVVQLGQFVAGLAA